MDLLNWITDNFQKIVDGIIKALPKSPIVFLSTNPSISKVLSCVNWFIPIYLWISVLETWLIAIATYYIYQVILRWVKAIE